MFNAPQIILQVPEIQKIYEINDSQFEGLDSAVKTLDGNICLDTMDMTTIKRWEKMLKLNVYDGDTEASRRFRVKAKVLERLPYSYRVILNRIEALCPGGCTLTVAGDRLSLIVDIALKYKKMRADIEAVLEDMLPLNMRYSTEIIWNTYGVLGNYTHYKLSQMTYLQLREEVIE